MQIRPKSIILLLIYVFQSQTLQDVVEPSYVNFKLTTQMACQLGTTFTEVLPIYRKKFNLLPRKFFVLNPLPMEGLQRSHHSFSCFIRHNGRTDADVEGQNELNLL